jgi:hypothetical protein
MDYFSEESPYSFYSTIRFRIQKAELTYARDSTRQKLRNLIPFRSVLRFLLFNLFDSIYFELVES